MFKYQAATLLLFSSFDHCCMCSFNILKYCAYQKRLYIENTFFTIRHMHTMALTEHKLLKLLNVKRELGSAERHHTIHCRLTHTHNKKCLTLRLLNKNKMEKRFFLLTAFAVWCSLMHCGNIAARADNPFVQRVKTFFYLKKFLIVCAS